MLLAPFFSFCQLAGSYTVGGITPDYSTITEVANALSQNGINAPSMHYTDIRNNIIANEGGGYAANGYSRTGLVLDYNNYYTTGANIDRWNGTVINDFTNWEFNTQQDANSISINPQFQSTDNLHTNNIALANGIPINNITEDFEGDERNPLKPYIGADEAPTAFDDIGIINLVDPAPPFPQGTNEISINVANNFTEPLTNATISWSVDADSIREVLWTGNIPSGTSKSIPVSSFQFDVAQPYDLKIWVSEPNGKQTLII